MRLRLRVKNKVWWRSGRFGWMGLGGANMGAPLCVYVGAIRPFREWGCVGYARMSRCLNG